MVLYFISISNFGVDVDVSAIILFFLSLIVAVQRNDCYLEMEEMFSRGCVRISRTIFNHSQVISSFVQDEQLFHFSHYCVASDVREKIMDRGNYEACHDNIHAKVKLGAPMLFAMKESPQLHELVARGIENPLGVVLAMDYLERSRGIQRTRDPTIKYANLALEAIETLPRNTNKDSELSRRALMDLTQIVVSRTK